jgi:integrase
MSEQRARRTSPVPPPFRLGSVLPLRATHAATVPLRPLQFPSLAHFVDACEGVIQSAASVEGLSPTTIQWMRDCVRSFEDFLRVSGSDRAFLSGDIERQGIVLEAWLASLRTRALSRTTIRTYWNALNAVCTRLQRRHHLANPFGYFQPPQLGPTQPRLLTKADAERLLLITQNCRWKTPLQRERNVAIVGLMLLAGLRRGEVLRLFVSDVDLDRGTLRVRRGKGRYGGKDRTAYAPPQLQQILRSYLGERDRAHRSHPELITSGLADAPIKATGIKRLFEVLSRAMHARVSPHMLRHTYATLLRTVGVPDRVAMDLMGHTTLTMLKRYSHVYDGEQADAAQKLRLDVDL